MKRLFKAILFFLFYVKEVVMANLQIAHQILGRRSLEPAFLSVSVKDLNDLQLLIVTNLITMTPGRSLSISPLIAVRS